MKQASLRHDICSHRIVTAIGVLAVGGVTGSVTGSLQLLLVPAIMQATGQYFNVQNDYGSIIIFVAAGMLITLVASISPAVKASKLDIVSSLKYD